MFLWGGRKRCVEEITREREVTCRHCGSDGLFAIEAQWAVGASVLDVYLSCYNCELETQIALSREEYKRCGFDPYEALPE